MIKFDSQVDELNDRNAQQRYRVRTIEDAQNTARFHIRQGDPQGIGSAILKKLKPAQRVSDWEHTR